MSRLQELRTSLGELDDQSKKILDFAESEKRAITGEEQQEWDKINTEIESISAEVLTREKQAERTAKLAESVGRKSVATDPGRNGNADPVADQPLSYDFGKQVGTVTIEPDNPLYATLAARSSDEYDKAFARYLATGQEIRADLQVTPDTKGGYLTSTRFVAELIKQIDDDTPMRQLCRVLPPLGAAVSVGIPTIETKAADADWTAEVPASDISEDTTLAFGKRELMPHLLTKLFKLSEMLMRTAVISAESIIRDEMARLFGETEEKAFLTGSGAQRPLGVFTANSQGISTSRDTTAASSSTITADELIDVQFAIKGGYQSRLTWLMHRDTLKIIRKLKDGNGQYLWAPGITGGLPSTILDRPYVLSEFAPNTFTTQLYVLILGDFSKYWIADSLDLTVRVLPELFTLTNEVGFKGQKNTDGMPVLEEAFQRLILQ